MIRTSPNAQLSVMRIAGSDPAVPLPGYKTSHAAGMDICSNLAEADRAAGLIIAPGARAMVPTGLAFAVPEGLELQVRPRSGLALKEGVTLANAPGTVDADYRGEVGVILINHGDRPVTIGHGERIAQIVLAPVVHATLTEVDRLSRTARGSGGFGSTGR